MAKPSKATNGPVPARAPAPAEISELLDGLISQKDRAAYECLADEVNSQARAMAKLEGQTTWGAKHVHALLLRWLLVLKTGSPAPADQRSDQAEGAGRTACLEPVPGADDLCTLDAGHSGDHRCNAGDAHDRLAGRPLGTQAGVPVDPAALAAAAAESLPGHAPPVRPS